MPPDCSAVRVWRDETSRKGPERSFKYHDLACSESSRSDQPRIRLFDSIAAHTSIRAQNAFCARSSLLHSRYILFGYSNSTLHALAVTHIRTHKQARWSTLVTLDTSSTCETSLPSPRGKPSWASAATAAPTSPLRARRRPKGTITNGTNRNCSTHPTPRLSG